MSSITAIYKGDLRTECTHVTSSQKLCTDAPNDNHGKGEYFSPTDLVATALGSCVLTLMGITAQKLDVDIQGAKATIHKTMSHTPPRRIAKISVHVHVPKDFDNQIKELIEAAGLSCPVHESLDPNMIQDITFSWGDVCN